MDADISTVIFATCPLSRQVGMAETCEALAAGTPPGLSDNVNTGVDNFSPGSPQRSPARKTFSSW